MRPFPIFFTTHKKASHEESREPSKKDYRSNDFFDYAFVCLFVCAVAKDDESRRVFFKKKTKRRASFAVAVVCRISSQTTTNGKINDPNARCVLFFHAHAFFSFFFGIKTNIVQRATRLRPYAKILEKFVIRNR